jgi:hypothetical protein
MLHVPLNAAEIKAIRNAAGKAHLAVWARAILFDAAKETS